MRLPRLTFPGMTQNVVLRANNREQAFKTDHDYRVCIDYLHQSCEKYKCAVHAYVFMPDHMHLLVTSAQKCGVGKMLQLFSRQYVQYFNRHYNRSGSLWSGRYKSALVDRVQYGIDCCRYIETNPMRSMLVGHPGEYQWSSYNFHAEEGQDSLVSPLNEYLSLGINKLSCSNHYKKLCDIPLDKKTCRLIQSETDRSRVIGNESFLQEVENLLGVDLSIKSRGGDRRSDGYRRLASSCVNS